MTGRCLANHLHDACWERCPPFYTFAVWRVAVGQKNTSISFVHRHSSAADQWLGWKGYSLSIWKPYVSTLSCIPGFMCMDGDEVANATMCPTTQCTTCWCPKGELSDPDVIYLFRNTDEVRDDLAKECKRLLHSDGQPRDRCKEKVLVCCT